jgi:hypothetical protein
METRIRRDVVGVTAIFMDERDHHGLGGSVIIAQDKFAKYKRLVGEVDGARVTKSAFEKISKPVLCLGNVEGIWKPEL